MSVTAQAVRELHRIHQQLRDLRDRLGGGPRQIRLREGGLARIEAELTAARDEHKATRMGVDQKQLLLKACETKLHDRRVQLNTCNTNREYQTMLEQIAADEMAKSVLEDEIIEALEKIEKSQQAVHVAEANVVKGKTELDKVRGAVAQEEQSLRNELQRVEAELAQAEAALPDDFRADYQRIVKTRGDDAMAPVEDDCCGGCRQKLTPNLLNQIQMSRVILCVGCGRFIYRAEGG